MNAYIPSECKSCVRPLSMICCNGMLYNCSCMFLLCHLATCPQCDLTVNPNTYVANPCNPNSFYQCVNVNGVWNAYLRPCPPCLAWNSVTLVCSDLVNPLLPLSDPSCRVNTITVAPQNGRNSSCVNIVNCRILDCNFSFSLNSKRCSFNNSFLLSLVAPTLVGSLGPLT